MDIKKTLEKINKDREKVEACFVFSCWSDPDLFDEYKNVYEEGKTMLSAGKRLRYSLFIILPTLNYYLKRIMNSKSIKT